jgi:ATP-dependent RNA helicase DDX3X
MKVPTGQKNTLLIQVLEEIGPKTLIFTATKSSAQYLGDFLYGKGYKSDCMHGDLTQQQREQALGDFRTGLIEVLVATDVAARGIDVEDISHVINFDLPTNIDDYVHRIGRTGRAGKKGMATSFYSTDKNSSLLKDLIAVMEESSQSVEEWMINENESESYKPYSNNRSYGRGYYQYSNNNYEAGGYDNYERGGYESRNRYRGTGRGNYRGNREENYNEDYNRSGPSRQADYNNEPRQGGNRPQDSNERRDSNYEPRNRRNENQSLRKNEQNEEEYVTTVDGEWRK